MTIRPLALSTPPSTLLRPEPATVEPQDTVALGPPQADPGLMPRSLSDEGRLASVLLSDDNIRHFTRWQVELGAPLRVPPYVSPDGTVYVASAKGALCAVSKDGKVLWRRQLDGEPAGPARAGRHGLILQATRKGGLFGFGADGRQYFRGQLEQAVDMSSNDAFARFGPSVRVTARAGLDVIGDPVPTADGRLYLGTGSGVHLMDASGGVSAIPGTGMLSVDRRGAVSPAVAVPVGPLGADLVVDRRGEGLSCVHVSGRPRWTFPTRGHVTGAAAMDARGNTYVAMHTSGDLPAQVTAQVLPEVPTTLVSLDPNGKVRWRVPLPGNAPWAPTITADGQVCVGVRSGQVLALSAKDGAVAWQYQTGLPLNDSPVVSPDGTVFVPAGDKHLHALAPDGKTRWCYARPGWTASRPAVPGDGVMYVGGADGWLYALESQDLNRAVAEPPKPGIQQDESFVVVGGVRLPVRR